MKHRSLQTLYKYWNGVRAGRIAPRRLEIEPARIAGILAETFMLERVTATEFHFRLAGSRLCELFGLELRGTNFLDGWSAADRAVLERQLATVCEQGAVATLTVEAGADVRSRIEIEVILLPLVHAGTKVERIIGAMSTSSPAPWLAGDYLRDRRLISHELIWPDGRPHAVIERAGGQAPFAPALSGVRIVKSDRRQFRVLDGGRTEAKHSKS
ncbi:MAG: PAS domain-containing protein [Hyphomicrobiaceae bacterium]|nr:MAG: PAS domain-containing protein [Hyphomicrobiaceae bacterium]